MTKNVLLSLCFMAAGIALAVWGFRNLATARESNSWPTVRGTITASRVVRNVEHYTDSDHHRRTRVVYHPQVRYRYAVDGQTFSGSRVTMGDYSSSSKRRARKICVHYPAGSSCKVFYDPDQPESAVLKAGMSFGTILPPVMGVLFALIGVAIPILGRKKASTDEG
jgi:hypothetical protein